MIRPELADLAWYIALASATIFVVVGVGLMMDTASGMDAARALGVRW